MAFQILIDDSFGRANTAVGSTANSTNVTGPTTFVAPSTGAPYIDVIGTKWELLNGALTAINLTGNDYSDAFLLRPSTEDQIDSQISITTTVPYGSGAGSAPVAVLRANRSSNIAYGAFVYYGGGTGTTVFSIVKLGPGASVATTLATSSPSLGATSGPFVVTFSAVGATPTTLTATIALASTPGTIIATLNTTDSTAGLQVAGGMGVAANSGTTAGTNIPVFSRLTTYSTVAATPATALTLSGPTSGPVGTPSSNFTVGANGSLSSNVVVTPSDGGANGTFSPTSLTLTSASISGTFTYTPTSTGAKTISITNSGSLTNPSSVTYTSNAASLSIGTLSCVATQSTITINLTANLAGGSATGYQYKIYRGTDPNFTISVGSLLATVTSMPYIDSTPVAGTEYFYAVVGNDSVSTTVNAIPTGFGTVTTGPLCVAAKLSTASLNMVFIGDSITYGAGLSNAGSATATTVPYNAVTRLKKLLGIRNIYPQNKGISGTTTTDWAPGGTFYNGAAQANNTSSAAYVLNAANPTATMVFSVMLGTNDSASSGTSNGGVAGLNATQFKAKLKAITDQLLVDWPAAKVFLHLSPWYSPNFQNSSVYLQDGLSRLFSYRDITRQLVLDYATSNPGHVYLGDTQAFDYFAKNYLAEQQQESGNNGTFSCHPNAIGAVSLGEFHATAIANALYTIVGDASNAALVSSVVDTDLVTLVRSGTAQTVQASVLKTYLASH